MLAGRQNQEEGAAMGHPGSGPVLLLAFVLCGAFVVVIADSPRSATVQPKPDDENVSTSGTNKCKRLIFKGDIP